MSGNSGRISDKGENLGRNVGAEDPGNRCTVASYEACAADYARSTAPTPGSDDRCAVRHFLEALPIVGRVLEVGSGPGWDADWLEDRGVDVRRTDAAAAFVAMQRARGASAELLDVVTDDLGGSYVGVIALYVFQHIDRPRLPEVLAKISCALVDGGNFLLTLREGRGDTIERGNSGGSYYVTKWEKPDIEAILDHLGFRERWSRSSEDSEGRWLTILTSKWGQDD